VTDTKALISGELVKQIEDTARAENRPAAEVVQDAIDRYLRLKRREKLYACGEAQAELFGIHERDVPELVKETRTPRGR